MAAAEAPDRDALVERAVQMYYTAVRPLLVLAEEHARTGRIAPDAMIRIANAAVGTAQRVARAVTDPAGIDAPSARALIDDLERFATELRRFTE